MRPFLILVEQIRSLHYLFLESVGSALIYWIYEGTGQPLPPGCPSQRQLCKVPFSKAASPLSATSRHVGFAPILAVRVG